MGVQESQSRTHQHMWRRLVRWNSTEAVNYAHRKEHISKKPAPFYPTLAQLRGKTPAIRLPGFISKFDKTDFSESPNRRSREQYRLEGKVRSVRKSGRGLFFIDVMQDNQKVQIYTSNKLLDVSKDDFAAVHNLVRRGDHVTCIGHAYRTKTGELSLQAADYVQIASPCLESTTMPDKIRTRKVVNANRVMNYLVDEELRQRIAIKGKIVQTIRDYLVHDGFLEVQTPILSGRGTGANAEPFQTHLRFLPKTNESSVETHEEIAEKYEPLQLRVAPELWLKKMVIAGFDKIFEIGPNFRNEGIDATHNPEFLSCEFYRSFTSLEELMEITEAIFQSIHGTLSSVQDQHSLLQQHLPKLANLGLAGFPKYEFIPTLEKETGVRLPKHLTSEALLEYYEKIGLPAPAQKNPAALLDTLSSTFLELLSETEPNTPIFIFNQPALMSPLAKSTRLQYGDREYDVSLRFELFINGKEYVNSYEEENSPFDQKQKFLLQQRNKAEFNDNESVVPDWHYVQAMQYGLPPTGGWGCGIDRLAMLFSGATRIEDVLAFGTLRDVIRQ